MTNWKKKQQECKACQGRGYHVSEIRHESGRGPAWAARCSECQPFTMDELKEAAEQEKKHEHH